MGRTEVRVPRVVVSERGLQSAFQSTGEVDDPKRFGLTSGTEGKTVVVQGLGNAGYLAKINKHIL